MIIPRFSLRWLLFLTAVCAIFSLVLAGAAQGQEWAAGFSIAIGSLVLVALLHALLFLAAWVTNQALLLTKMSQAPGSPFADAKPPPQIIPPRDPE